MFGRRVFCAFCLGLFLTGCVRYTPSRSELNEPTGIDPAVERVGPEAFYAQEKEQDERIAQLIADRTARLAISSASEKASSYRLGAGDEISLSIENFPEVSKAIKIQSSGKISLPFVGDLHVAGKTEDEVKKLIVEKITDYVVNPQVELTITEFSAHKVWVAGEVGLAGGTYPLKRENYSLLEVLSEVSKIQPLSGNVVYLYPEAGVHNYPGAGAGKPSEAGASNAQIAAAVPAAVVVNPGDAPREVSAGASPSAEATPASLSTNTSGETSAPKEESAPMASVAPGASVQSEPMASPPTPTKSDARIQIDLEKLYGGIDQKPLFIPLLPGDLIVVPPPTAIQVFGEVQNRGLVPVSVKPFLLSAINAAGGLTFAANVHEIEIFRELSNGRKVALDLDLEEHVLRQAKDIRLRDGDIVWVPSHPTRFYQMHAINFINSIFGGGLVVTQAVQQPGSR